MNVDDAYRIKQTTTIELKEVKIAHAREFFINKEGKSVKDSSPSKAKKKHDEENFESAVNKSRESNLLDSGSESSEDSEGEEEDFNDEKIRKLGTEHFTAGRSSSSSGY